MTGHQGRSKSSLTGALRTYWCPQIKDIWSPNFYSWLLYFG